MKIQFTLSILLISVFISGCATTHQKHLDEISNQYLHGKKIVMITHPLCHFCEWAFEGFADDVRKELKDAIYITVIQPQYPEEMEALKKWEEHYKLKATIIYRDDTLPQLNLDLTPQFYFFENGILKHKIVGYIAKDGLSPALRKILVDFK